MYEVEEELKTIYKNDFLPAAPKNYDKWLILFFPELSLTIDTRTPGMVDIDSFSIEESLCSEKDLTLGSCEASIFKIKLNGIIQDLSGKTVFVTQYILDFDDTEYEMPLGKFIVKSVGRQSDLGFKEITALNTMSQTDINVAAWYNSLTWPQTTKSMKESLLSYLEIEFESQNLTNDDVVIHKTINPSKLLARDVLRRLCEINAGFGQISRLDKFKVKQLAGLGLYPSETLYPSEDLFPSESGEYITAGYQSIDYEEYSTELITSVTIRQDNDDIGASVGTSGNGYFITGNFLLFGKSSSELTDIANEIFLQIKNKYYRPHKTIMIGLPYLEVGDSVTIITSEDAIETFIFNRVLKGIHSLTDEISATGSQKRPEISTPNSEFESLKGKTLRIEKSIDELSISLADTAEGLESMISFTAGELQTQITDNYNGLQGQITLTASGLQTQITNNQNNTNSQITQLSNSIDLKVSYNNIISSINLSPESIKINASNILLEGIVTANNNFKVLLDGSIEAKGGKFDGIIENINSSGGMAAKIHDGSFYGTSFYSYEYSGIVGNISTSKYSSVLPGLITVGLGIGLLNRTLIEPGSVTTNSVNTNTLNGSTPITTGNIGSNMPSTNTIPADVVNSAWIQFSGGRAAGYQWSLDTFEPKTPSDERLKDKFETIDKLPDQMFMDIQMYQFEFVDEVNIKGIVMGVKAQQVIEVFENYGYDPFKYNMIEKGPLKKSESQLKKYIKDDSKLVVNYSNLFSWGMRIIQKMYKSIALLENH